MNKTKLSWANPTEHTDGSPYDQQSMGAGYELSFNDEPGAVSLPFAFGTEFDMASLEAYKALPAGAHTVNLRVVSREGVRGLPGSATFQKIKVPAAPAAVVVG